MNQKGGGYLIQPTMFTSNIIKMKISTIKKITQLFDTLYDEQKKKLNGKHEYEYAYLHIINYKVVAVYFITKLTDRLLEVTVGFENSMSSFNLIRQKLNLDGYVVIRMV